MAVRTTCAGSSVQARYASPTLISIFMCMCIVCLPSDDTAPRRSHTTLTGTLRRFVAPLFLLICHGGRLLFALGFFAPVSSTGREGVPSGNTEEKCRKHGSIEESQGQSNRRRFQNVKYRMYFPLAHVASVPAPILRSRRSKLHCDVVDWKVVKPYPRRDHGGIFTIEPHRSLIFFTKTLQVTR